jgi:putative aldouronate transport system permease protein
MVLPFMVLVFLLWYMPLRAWIYAFYNYKLGLPLKGRFVGLGNFVLIFSDPYALSDILRVMKNTLGMFFLGIVTSPLSLVFAIMLNEIRIMPLRKSIQTLTTIPHFISWILVYSIAYAMFSVSDGFVNHFLEYLGFIDSGINFLAGKDHVWLGMWAWGRWKELGWSAIIYIAAISSIDQELYEAAKVDGAGRFRCIWYITIPGLLPTFFVLLVISIANMLNSGMEQYYVFQNGMNKSSIEVLDLYVYNQGIGGFRLSYSITVGILKSLVSLLLLAVANQGSKLVREEKIF